jgi:hypothetical protein
MKTLLLGTDFAYDINNVLRPIETNTNVAIDKFTPEKPIDIFDLTELNTLIETNGFTEITYIGAMYSLHMELEEYCELHNITYVYHHILNHITIPVVEDSETHLIIRSAYDTNAIVDDLYCKDNVKFFNLIKEQSFGSEIAYFDDVSVNNITTIIDNGNHPNFILKSKLPYYDDKTFPKLFKVTTTEELNVILQNVDKDYFMMPFYVNMDKQYVNHLYVLRGLNLLLPPNLNSISLGAHRKVTVRNIDNLSEFDSITYELDYSDRGKYLTGQQTVHGGKLRDTDRVEMADETYKTALDLQVGDMVKTVKVANPNNVDLTEGTNYQITYEEFVSGSEYTTAEVTGKQKVDKFVRTSKITFTDGTTWTDTVNSSYIILRDNQIQFKRLDAITKTLISDDQIVLVDTGMDEFTTILKTIETIETDSFIFSGYEITVIPEHVFLTLNEEGSSFAAIEHNLSCIYGSPSTPCVGTCSKGGSCTQTGPSTCSCV